MDLAELRKNQMRSTNAPGGPEGGVTISVACDEKALATEFTLETNFAEASGKGATVGAASRASGECFPLQHFCPELGRIRRGWRGIMTAGVSWCNRFCGGHRQLSQSCRRPATRAPPWLRMMATLPLSRNIFLMVTNKIPLMLYRNFTGSILLDPECCIFSRKNGRFVTV